LGLLTLETSTIDWILIGVKSHLGDLVHAVPVIYMYVEGLHAIKVFITPFYGHLSYI
jgi:hypothetical protein